MVGMDDNWYRRAFVGMGVGTPALDTKVQTASNNLRPHNQQRRQRQVGYLCCLDTSYLTAQRRWQGLSLVGWGPGGRGIDCTTAPSEPLATDQSFPPPALTGKQTHNSKTWFRRPSPRATVLRVPRYVCAPWQSRAVCELASDIYLPDETKSGPWAGQGPVAPSVVP